MNKIQLIENNTKKILESGFIEAFIEHYVEIKNIDETENTRLMYLMCNDIEEKKVVTLNQIDKTKSIIKDIGFSTLSFAYIDNMKRNLKLEKSNSWINRFADEFKDNIIHFQSVSYLYENTYNFKDERFTDEVKVALFQEHYEHDSYLKYKPLIKDVNILLEKEDELIDDILYLIDDYQKNECWDIDILSIEHFRKYNTSIDVLFKLSELLFQLKQLLMYNEFLEIENNEINNINVIDESNGNMKELIDDLFRLSIEVNNIPLDKINAKFINFFNDNFVLEDYTNIDTYYFQEMVLNNDTKKINLILKNLERAINSNCKNSINFDTIDYDKNYYYSIKGDDIVTIPENFNDFRLQFIKFLLKSLKIIHNNISSIIGKDILYKEIYNKQKEKKVELIDFSEDVYKLNLEYFLSINPKANEQFFIETKIFELEKSKKELFQQINFSCDDLNSIDGQLNNQNRNDYFFKIQYLDYLKNKNSNKSDRDAIQKIIPNINVNQDEITNNLKVGKIKLLEIKKKIPVKFYVLTYILDCRANDKRIEDKKKNLILIGEKLLKNETTKGITFYRVFKQYVYIIKKILDDNNSNKLSTHFELDWKDFVLQLSTNSEKIERYILEKKLV